MEKKRWNMGELKALMSHHAAALEPIMDRHPEMNGCGMGVDDDTNAPYFFMILPDKTPRPDVRDVPAQVGTGYDVLEVRVAFRPPAYAL